MGETMEILFQDLRYAARTLLKSRGFTVVAVVTLALGIAANTAIFSVIEAVLLRSLPYKNPKQLVVLTDPLNSADGGLLFKDFEQIQKNTHSFSELEVYFRDSGLSRVTLGGSVEPEQVQGAFVSGNFFTLMGVAPELGRTFDAQEERSQERVVLLSHSLWLRRFGGARDVLGRTLQINNRIFRVIGVVPATFQFPARDQMFWAPLTTNPFWNDPELEESEAQHHTRFFYERWQAVGRLRDGVSLAAAQSEVDGIWRRLAQTDPDQSRGQGIDLKPLRVELGGNTRLALFILFGAVCFVLLIACSNVANLALARGAGRQREMAIRSALGAHRARLVRQLFTESVLLALIAGGIGLFLANVEARLLIALAPADIPRLEQTGIDAGVLAFSLALSLFSAILFGLFPAFRLSRRGCGELINSSRGYGSDPGRRRARNLLVASEFALAVTLLTGAGLLLRSYLAVGSVDLGFQPEHVLTLHVAMPGMSDEQRGTFYSEMLGRVRQLPGVQFIGAIDDLFELGAPDERGLRAIEDRAVDRPDQWSALNWKTVSGDYFPAMGTTLLKGRLFTDQDGPNSPVVAVIDQSMARRYWPNQDPIGAHVKGLDARGRHDDWVTIIGVVGDMRRGGLERQPTAHIFTWYKQNLLYGVPDPNWPGDLVIRVAQDPRAAADTIRATIRQLNDRVILSPVTTLEDQLSNQVAPRRFQTSLLGIFSLLAMLLAAIGIYGVMHFSVAQRTHDLGVRMALGATRKDVLTMILREAAQLASIGIAAGLIGAAIVTRVLQNMLYGVRPNDPLTFIVVAVLLTAIAITASFIPARRATKVDPVVALRYE
jgi:putative ABC transport system permease protein